MSLPNHSPLVTPRPTTLAQAVAQARHPRNHATTQLEPHREELLRLRRAGESVESLVGGLRLIGIKVGRETMRRWLDRELSRKPARQRKRAVKLAAGEPALAAIAGTKPTSETSLSMPSA